MSSLGRLTAARGLPFRMPNSFPQASITAARLALASEPQGAIAAVTRAIFEAEFGRGEAIADSHVLRSAIKPLGLDFARLSASADGPGIKHMLRVATDSAASFGIFGAPTFRTEGGELFWGDDRLELALAWAP